MLDINNLLEYKNNKIDFKTEYKYIKDIIYKYKTYISTCERISILYMAIMEIIKNYNIDSIESLNVNLGLVHAVYFNMLHKETDGGAFYSPLNDDIAEAIEENTVNKKKELLYTFDYILTSKQKEFLHNIDNIFYIDSKESKIIKRIALRYKEVLNIKDYTFKNIVNKKLYELINSFDLESELRKYKDKKIIIDILYDNDNGLNTEDYKSISKCINGNIPLPAATKEKILNLFNENIIK